MTKKTISTLIISLVFGGGVQAQSFADAVKDGLSPLTNLVNSAKQSLSADTVSKKRADKKNIQSLTLKDGTAYVGEMKGKRPNGQGKAIYKNGDVYEGGFVTTFWNCKDLIKGLWNGIKDMTSWIIEKIKGFGDSILGGIKSFFGIKSPSRVFRDEVGAMLAEGVAEGIEENADTALDAMTGLSDDLLRQAGTLDGMSLGTPAINGLGVERSLQTRATATQAATAYPVGIGEKLDKILTAIEKGQVLAIDKKLLVGGTASEYDSTLGLRRALVARGAL